MNVFVDVGRRMCWSLVVGWAWLLVEGSKIRGGHVVVCSSTRTVSSAVTWMGIGCMQCVFGKAGEYALAQDPGSRILDLGKRRKKVPRDRRLVGIWVRVAWVGL